MFAASAVIGRQAAKTLGQRAFRSTPRAFGGADEPAYIHAKHMYDVGATKNRKLVFGVATAAVVLIGGYIPIYAIQFQQKKTQG